MKFSLKSYKTLNNLCILCVCVYIYYCMQLFPPSFFWSVLFCLYSSFSDSLCVGKIFSFNAFQFLLMSVLNWKGII